jgi:rhamnosyltransferase subunit B
VKIILTALGSAGDVHPIVGIGSRLKQLGHQVTIITSPYFAPLVERVGLELVPLGTAEEFQAAMNDPLLWHPRKGIRVVMQMGVLRSIPMIYQAIVERYVPGETVIGAHSLDFASRTAQEKLGVPVVTIHLAPSVFRTVYECPYLPPFFMPNWLPKSLKEAQFRLGDMMIDRLIAGAINEMRRELNLLPVRRVMQEWWFSPERVIGLFPDWFGPKQPDWPPQTELVGFPLWDEREITEPLPEVEAFLESGDPPVVFTPGSAMSHAHEFFRIAIEACQKLGRRAILLTRQANQIPAYLPPGIKHFAFVPFSKVLPRSAALVHHGGIGTLSQALSAGIPHLVMPMAYDQPDNARRLVRLGVAQAIPEPKFTLERVVPALQRLLDSQEVSHFCRTYAERMRNDDGIGRAAELITDLAKPARRERSLTTT